MTAALLVGTAERPQLASHPEAVPRLAGLFALSPRLVLLAVPEAPGIERMVEAALTGPAGPLRPPLSWQALAVPGGRLHLLLARAQTDLVPDTTLRLATP